MRGEEGKQFRLYLQFQGDEWQEVKLSDHLLKINLGEGEVTQDTKHLHRELLLLT